MLVEKLPEFRGHPTGTILSEASKQGLDERATTMAGASTLK